MADLLTQAELEREMVDGGRARMAQMMQKNEGDGGATNNPYASAVFRRFVLPMAAMIEADVQVPRPGRSQAYVPLLRPMDAQAVAYLAVRHALNMLMQETDVDARRVMATVGKAVYSELLLMLFENIEPDLFYTLANDLDRRMSKNERYRMTVFKMQAKKNGIDFPEWGNAGITQVGSYLIGLLESLGMLRTYLATEAKNGRPNKVLHVSLTEEVAGLIGQIKDFMIENSPVYLPSVEQPLDWKGVADGGWHTNAMKRAQPFAIKTEGSWSELAEYDLSTPLAAINALQHVEWQVNRQMLGAIKEIARYIDTDEIVGYAEQAKPDKPFWLAEDMKTAEMTPDEKDEFKGWRRAMAQWFTEQKIRGTKYGRFNQALRVAEKFSLYPKIHFVYFADFRGRLYVQTTGISPQGSDLQKALLRFAVGKPLETTAAVEWFKINGANKYGFDKASYDDRISWVDERRDIILRLAADPIAHYDDWKDADSPLQFLAWAFEYKRWHDAPDTFVSHLPVGMDGTCNGLQNFSAMLRDEVGGKATNLLPGLRPSDIYTMVADRTAEKLRAQPDYEVPEPDGTDELAKTIAHYTASNRFRRLWLDHGITRSLVKRSVMTKPYGSTRFSSADFIVADYLKAGKAPEFAKEEYHPAARYLSKFVWEAISEVVIKADEAMTWLQNASRLILQDHDHIRWVTPSGFPVIQRYQKSDIVTIRTRLSGRMIVGRQTDAADKNNHKNGVAPNFVHSVDAEHMRAVAIAASQEGMSVAMIHDDFGTHAADAERFAVLIRETFVALHSQHDLLGDFAALYDLPNPPKPGNLDLSKVRESRYFFG